jgi:asparagine synthase (glutamine-hydrolysing)
MTAALIHRGPDGSGYHVDTDNRVFLGHRRLSILDIDGGAQPMWNENESVAVIFNGEIYNHVELRRELELRGHRFHSDHSDTEVLVHGYEEWGDNLPLRLNGMFAFVVWDRNRRQLFLARDRFGEKPLFYGSAKGLFIFSSELVALTRHPHFDTKLDVRSLQKLFAHGFFPRDTSPYRAARKLPGGHSLRFDLQTGRAKISCYWRFVLATDPRLSERSEDDLADELDDLIVQSIRRRSISDVPLGIFLSGGLDSSAVVAVAANLVGSTRVKTFTIGFNEPTFDESGYAELVANQFNSEHHLRRLELDHVRNLMPSLLKRVGEPLGDASLLPTYLLSAFTREFVKVALTGDGGDELFAGYDPFRALGPASLYNRVVPAPLHRLLKGLAGRLPVSTRNISFEFKVKRSLNGLSYDPRLWNPVWLGPLSPCEIHALFESPIETEDLFAEAIDLWENSPTRGIVDKTLEFYTNFYLQDGVLTKVDRAAMLNSLETRAIFLDNDLVEFSRKLPHSLKYRNGRGKYLLRKALKRRLPDAIISRPKKGFGIPLSSWLRAAPKTIPLMPVEGFVLEKMEDLWQQHRRGISNHGIALWTWLSVQGFLGAKVGGEAC